MAIGMTYEEYWYGDPLMVRAFYKAEKLRQQIINETAWLNGAYVYKALAATVGNALRKKGERPIEYPDKPISVNNAADELISEEERKKQEAIRAKAYMKTMVWAGKKWGKK